MRSTHVLAALLVCLLAATTLGCQDEDEPGAQARDNTAGPVERVYLGVSCSEPNSIRCDQVGLYVWLRRPARRVTAHFGGHQLPLRKRAAPSIQPGTHWQAFLNNAGLDNGRLAVQANKRGRWFGQPSVQARIRLVLELHDRPNITQTLRTPLGAGYG